VLRSSDNVRRRRLAGHTIETLDRADALLFGRVTYETMEGVSRLGFGSGAVVIGMSLGGSHRVVATSPLPCAEVNTAVIREESASIR